MKDESNGEKIIFTIIFIIIIIVIGYVIYTLFSSNKSFYTNENTNNDVLETKDNINNSSNISNDNNESNNENNANIDTMNIDKNTVKKTTEKEIATFTSTLYDKDENRIYNIGLAIEKLNGTVVKKDEEFSFNNTIGPMDETHGYKQAIRV